MERAGIGNITRSYFRKAVGIVLMYDIGNRDSLDDLRDWVFYLQDNISWRQQQSITYVVWANNRDRTLTPVSEEQLNSFLTFLGLNEDHCSDVNAFTGYNVFESYQSLIEKVHLRMRTGVKCSNHPISLNDSEETATSSYSCSC